MTIIDILSFIGFPSMFLGMLGILWKKLVINDKMTKATQHGIQALLRNQLYSMYSKYSEKGYAPYWARENFENMYLQYHSLGSNGVMDDIRKKFLDLPLEENKHE